MKTQKTTAKNNFIIQHSFVYGNDVKLTFKQGRIKFECVWSNLLNNWVDLKENLERVINGWGMELDVDAEGMSIDTTFLVPATESDNIVFYILENYLIEAFSKDYLVRKKKICCKFVLDKRQFIQEFYNVLTFLAGNKKYKLGYYASSKGTHKYDFLSEKIEKFLDGKRGYKNHAKQVLACLSHTAKSAGDFYNLGLALYEANRYKSAIKILDKAIKMGLSKENLSWAFREKGRCFEELKQYKKAIFCFSKAIKLDKNYVAAYNNRGSVYSDAHVKKYTLALKDYNKAIRLEPENPDYIYNKALVLKKQKKFSLAISLLSKVIGMDNKDADAYIQMGNCWQQLGEYEKAKKNYKKVLYLNSNNGNLKFKSKKAEAGMLGWCAESCLEAKDKQTALEAVKQCLKFNPKDKKLQKLQKKLSNSLKTKKQKA